MADEFDSLDFDDDDGRRPLGRRIFTALIAVIAVGGFAAIVSLAYNDGADVEIAGAPALIKSARGPDKVRPDSPGGMKVPHRDKSVYQNLLDEKKRRAERFERLLPSIDKSVDPPAPLPAEETAREPEPSGAPPAPAIAPPKRPPELDSASSRRPRTRGGETAVAPLAGPARSAKAPSNMEASTAPAKTVRAAEPAAKPVRGGYRVQLASLRTNGAVQRAWSRLQRTYPDLLGQLALSVVRKDLGASRGVFFRMQAGPLTSAGEAETLCGRLKRHKQDCIIVRP